MSSSGRYVARATCHNIPHDLNSFQEAETGVATSINTAECFESSLVLAELEALAHSAPDDMIRVRPLLVCCFYPLKPSSQLANTVIAKAVEADVDPSNFVPLRAIIWVWERGTSPSELSRKHLIFSNFGMTEIHQGCDNLAIRFRVQRQWLDQVWDWGGNQVSTGYIYFQHLYLHLSWQVEKGPSNLSRAILLEEAMVAWYVLIASHVFICRQSFYRKNMSVKFASLENKEMYLRRQQTLALAVANGKQRPRTSVLTSLLLENILLVGRSDQCAEMTT